MEQVIRKLNVVIAREKAFQKFLNELNEWWPKEYTWSQDKLKEIRIDGRENGLCTEVGPHGFRCDWGRVTALIENEKIEIKWQINFKRQPVPDPSKASDLKLVFKESNGSTMVEFKHTNFENHGDSAEDYQKTMDGKAGWDYILNCYKRYCEDK